MADITDSLKADMARLSEARPTVARVTAHLAANRAAGPNRVAL